MRWNPHGKHVEKGIRKVAYRKPHRHPNKQHLSPFVSLFTHRWRGSDLTLVPVVAVVGELNPTFSVFFFTSTDCQPVNQHTSADREAISIFYFFFHYCFLIARSQFHRCEHKFTSAAVVCTRAFAASKFISTVSPLGFSPFHLRVIYLRSNWRARSFSLHRCCCCCLLPKRLRSQTHRTF